jgi:DNA-directed RNA polymerase specialized sigma24 family protein
LFSALAAEPHPHTANQIVETLYHLLPCSPREVFLLACLSIMSSSEAGLQHESLAVGNVVKLIERALADHRELFQPQGAGDECFTALLRVLDLFVEAGWAEARRLTHRLEEINR